MAVSFESVKLKEGYMPITVRKVPSRAVRVEVDVVPAEWQIYITH